MTQPETHPLVCVIILNYNGRQHLEYNLPSLLATDYPNLHIVVIDNASSDDSIQYIQQHYPQVALLPSSQNLGWAGGNNLGIRYALSLGAKYVVFANNDIRVDKRWLTVAVNLAEPEPLLGIIGYQILEPRGGEYDAGFEQAIATWSTLQTTMGQGYVGGMAMFVRAALFEQIGLIDEVFFAYCEENDFEKRAIKAGYRAVTTNIPIWHYGQASFGKIPLKAAFLQIRNDLRLSVKHDTILGFIYQVMRHFAKACLPGLKIDPTDPVSQRLRPSNLAVNFALVLYATLWNLWQLPQTFSRRRADNHRIQTTRQSLGLKSTQVVIVGQSYIGNEARKKLSYLAKQPGYTVSLIVPTTWEHDSFGVYTFQKADSDIGYQIFPIPIYTNGRVFAFAYSPIPLWRAIRQIKPDILQVEQEPGSLSLMQFVILSKLYRHAKLISFTWENLFYKQPGIRHYFEKFSLQRLNYLLVGNQQSAQVFRQKGYQGPLAVLPNVGVDAVTFSPTPQPELKQKLGLNTHFMVGFAGRLVAEKGCHDLLQAFAQLPHECQLLMLGSGPLGEDLKQTAQQLGLTDRVTFQPAVPHNEVANYLNCMDCLVLPSRTVPNGWREQFGLVLAQAMACGVPVIGSDSGAIPEVIADAGLIFPEGNITALRDCLLQLQQNPTLRAELSRKGRERVLTHYTHEQIAAQTVAIYKQLIP